MDGADISCISSCCPRLQHLEIRNTVLDSSDDFAGLQQLPETCTVLSVGVGAFSDKAAQVIGQLTQLQCLVWAGSKYLTDLGLEQLTGLLGLEQLTVEKCDLSHDITSERPQQGDRWIHLCTDPDLVSGAAPSHRRYACGCICMACIDSSNQCHPV